MGLATSCQQRTTESLEGYWESYGLDTTQNAYFPFELHFKRDTLNMIAPSYFMHQAKYVAEDDHLLLTLADNSKTNISFTLEADSVLYFEGRKFQKIAPEIFTSVPRYHLIGYKTNHLLPNDHQASSIHLIKYHGKTKAVLNDVVADLASIAPFLSCNDCHSLPPVHLYLGDHLEFRDLLNAYKWIAAVGGRQVTLITAHKGLDEFYKAKDYINIADSLMIKLFEAEGMPPFPPHPKSTHVSRTVLTIKDTTDFEKLTSVEDSSYYLIQVDDRIAIIDYLKLIERMQDNPYLDRKIVRRKLLTKPAN
ncbi:hypothetical protein [Catalinimonas alkaloidigena]|uniref:hypothetical protein n=1 Tax=Catalinimonas alkaloidigena TaxID=1075417 RepID=UPI001C4099AF|nr:hypothetical protein [Catalinimonas alkaloidigena]